MVSERGFSVDALAIELVDSERFLSETPVGGAHLLAEELISVVRRLADHSDTDLYPSDYLIEHWREQHEEFQDTLRKLEAGEGGYARGSIPMRNAWSRFLATGDLPKVLTIEPEFEQWTARSAALASRTQELKQVLSAESQETWATVGYLVATAKLIAVGVYASDYNCGDQRVLNRVLDTIREARTDYQWANELAPSDGIRDAIGMSQRLEDETIAALSTVNAKRAQWLRSMHLCLDCEKALGWGDRLSGADRHSHCPSQDNEAMTPFSRPRWGMIVGALAAVLLLGTLFGAFERKRPDPTEGHVSASLPLPFEDDGACPYEGCRYGTWIAQNESRVFRDRDRTSPVAFRLMPHEKVVALNGTVVTTQAGLSQVTMTVAVNGAIPPVGSTVSVLTYGGEGCVKVWFPNDRWAVPQTDAASGRKWPYVCEGLKEIHPAQSTWWVKVQNRNGDVGWADVSNVSQLSDSDQLLISAITDKTASIETKLARIDEMVRMGADINGPAAALGLSPTQEAILSGDAVLIRALLDRGMRVDGDNCIANLALQILPEGWAIVGMLLDSGMKTDCAGPVYHSVLRGSATPNYKIDDAVRSVELFASRGFDVNAKRANGRTILEEIRAMPPDSYPQMVPLVNALLSVGAR